MEAGDFIWYLLMVIVLFVPLAWNYFILYTLNWNQRKNLFSDSWIVFISWFISSLFVLILIAFFDARFYDYPYLVNPVSFVLLLVSANIFSITAVLKSREKKKLTIVDYLSRLPSSRSLNESISLGISNRKILQTAAIVAFLNLAMIISLVMFVKEISTRTKEEINWRQNFNYVSFE